MKAYCPKCGEKQEAFEVVGWNDANDYYKFVCRCRTAVEFHIRKEVKYA